MNKRFIKTHIIYTIILTVIALLMLRSETIVLFPISTAFVIGSLIYFIFSWVGFYERRIRFFKRVNSLASNASGCNFIFSDYGIEYSDAEKLYKHSWPLFSRFVIIDDTILIILKESSAVLFTLSKKELGENNYNTVVEILKEKLG